MRIRAIDWVRGLVILLMTVDHTGTIFDAAHFHSDSFRQWHVGDPLPTAEFFTRWITHLCAPVFVLLAGASLALSSEKRRGDPGQTRFIVTRGLLIAALDPVWMSLGFLILAGFTAIDDPAKPRHALAPLALFGSTAFFYYLLHVHLAQLAQLILQLDPREAGLAKTWISALLVVVMLAGPVWLYRRYKAAHPEGWTRYI